MQAGAWRCPHCAHWQSRLLWLSVTPAGWVLSWLVVFSIWCLPLLLLVTTVLPFMELGASSAPYRDQLHVTHSEMLVGARPDGPVVAVVGTLRNDSALKWYLVTVEVRFRDNKGRLVDVARRLLLPIQPHDEAAFRAETAADLPLELYTAYEVRVAYAREARWPLG
jgi:hypothetical protein